MADNKQLKITEATVRWSKLFCTAPYSVRLFDLVDLYECDSELDCDVDEDYEKSWRKKTLRSQDKVTLLCSQIATLRHNPRST